MIMTYTVKADITNCSGPALLSVIPNSEFFKFVITTVFIIHDYNMCDTNLTIIQFKTRM